MAVFVGQVVFCEYDGGGAEGVGLDDVGADVKVPLVNALNHVRPGEDEVFVASFIFCTAEVVGAEVEGLYCRAHCAVDHQDALAQGRFQGFDALV